MRILSTDDDDEVMRVPNLDEKMMVNPFRLLDGRETSSRRMDCGAIPMVAVRGKLVHVAIVCACSDVMDPVDVTVS